MYIDSAANQWLRLHGMSSAKTKGRDIWKGPKSIPYLTRVTQHLSWYMRFPISRHFSTGWKQEAHAEALWSLLCYRKWKRKKRLVLQKIWVCGAFIHQQYRLFFLVQQQPAQPTGFVGLSPLRGFPEAWFSDSLYPLTQGSIKAA